MKKICVLTLLASALLLSWCMHKSADYASPPTTAIPARNTYLLYICPDWRTRYPNKDYNGRVDISECSQSYTSGTLSFDDGVRITFGFVPQDVAQNVKVGEELYSTIIADNIKNESNVKPYFYSGFAGWISMENPKHTLSIVARSARPDGYYEITADAQGHKYTDKQFQKMIEDIINTFIPNH